MLFTEETTEIVSEIEGLESLHVRTGKAPATGRRSMLQADDYFKSSIVVPEKFNAYARNKPIPVQDWGNTRWGNCTIASECVLSQYFERKEQRKTVLITAEEAVRVYKELVVRRYGHPFEDMGAYEVDALNNWRNPEYTFRDTKGNPYTIDAYVRINHNSVDAIKRALFVSQGKGIKLCLSLPMAWAYRRDMVWDIPKGQALVGDYRPNSWGGHSMTAIAHWDKDWLYGLCHTWNVPMGRISWEAVAAYCDEAYMVIDSVNQWKKTTEKGIFSASKLVSDVNAVSDVKIK